MKQRRSGERVEQLQKWLEKRRQRRQLREQIADLAIQAEVSVENTPRIALAEAVRKYREHEEKKS